MICRSNNILVLTKASFFLLLALLMLIVHSCSSESGGDSEDDVYVINNSEFDICSDKTDAYATTKGINAAIENAKSAGYNKVKLTSGEYLIECADNGRWVPPTGGIFVPSDMTLDLKGTKIYLHPNDDEHYGVIQLDHVKNVTIIGGHLIGDRHEHTYAGNGSHEYGFGINMYSSENILLKDMIIEGMTGDAVHMGSYGFENANEGSVCKHIRITGCEFYDCRRQGISVVHARDIEIDNNTIYNIHGTDPQFGIDIEPEVNYGCLVESVKIHNNTIRDCVGGISFHGGTDMEAYENQLEGLCLLAIYSQRVRIYKNTVTSPGYISAGKGSGQRPCQDICIPTTGDLKNNCKTVVNQSIQTRNFECE
jgi:hypothetical protein